MAMKAQDVYAILQNRMEENPPVDGFSPIITENKDNDENTYKLDIVTKDGTITTPNLKGAAFAVSKVYASIDEMNAGFATDNVPTGGFVVIDTGSVEDEDTAKLYIKGESAYIFITDMSGMAGIQGPQGTGFRLRGAWKASTNYVNNNQYIDTVTYNGQTYACNTSHTSGDSWDESNWTVLAEKGTTTYSELTDKPKINGVELSGEISLDDLGVISKDSNVPVNFSIERPFENSPYVNISFGDPVQRQLQLYLPLMQFDGSTCFIAKELYSFYADLGGAPTTYNMVTWKETDKIEDLNEENGPYLVLSAKNSTQEEDNSGTITIEQYVISLKDYFIKEETDPTVPDWAKQDNKPTYTAEEVGALASDSIVEITPEELESAWGDVFEDEP